MCFTSCDGDFPTLRYTMELQIPHGFLERSVLKVFDTISKYIHIYTYIYINIYTYTDIYIYKTEKNYVIFS